jgi:hypothetical protein
MPQAASKTMRTIYGVDKLMNGETVPLIRQCLWIQYRIEVDTATLQSGECSFRDSTGIRVRYNECVELRSHAPILANGLCRVYSAGVEVA